MKIAHIVSTYPPYRGGMGNVAYQMVQELQKRGHHVDVFTSSQSEKIPHDSQPGIFRLRPVFSFRNSAFLPQLASRLSGYDVLHLHYPFFGGAESVSKFKKQHPKVPLIITYHMDVEGQGAVKTFFQLYKWTFFPRIMKQADRILVSSMDYAKASTYLDQVDAAKIEELPFGIPTHFKPQETKPQKEKVQLLFVAALDRSHYFKGLSILLKSLKKTRNTQSIELCIVGDGDMRKFYEQQVQDLQLENHVRFLGKISDKELAAAYQHADITVFPSTDRSEAFGLVQAESMACGTPVIASDLPGVRTLVNNCQGGLLIPPGSGLELTRAIDDLVAHEDKRQSLGKNAQSCIENQYRWPKIISRLQQIYQEALDV